MVATKRYRAERERLRGPCCGREEQTEVKESEKRREERSAATGRRGLSYHLKHICVCSCQWKRKMQCGIWSVCVCRFGAKMHADRLCTCLALGGCSEVAVASSKASQCVWKLEKAGGREKWEKEKGTDKRRGGLWFAFFPSRHVGCRCRTHSLVHIIFTGGTV